ncbi:MAG: DUF5058 family protein [Coprococcus sp.]|nr:DUF5058 family protein [Coprococcus sp.]
MFTKKAYEVSTLANVPREDCNKAFKIGLVSSIGPSFSIVTVLLALMATLGTATTWSRMALVGNAPQKLMMAELGAQQFGTAVGGAAYGADAYVTSIWFMSLHGCNFMIGVFLLLHHMDKIKVKLEKTDMYLMTVVGSGALAGVIAMLGVSNAKTKGGAFSYVCAFAATFLLGKAAKKIKWLGDYKVGFAMLISMLITQYIFSVVLV